MMFAPTLRVWHLLNRASEWLRPPTFGDLNAWHVGCHIEVFGKPFEIVAVHHTGGHVVVHGRTHEITTAIFTPLLFVEPDEEFNA